jgi:glycogen operon protein
MTGDDWSVGHARALGALFSGEAGLMHVTERGEPEPDATFLMLVNAGDSPLAFALPALDGDGPWTRVFDTAHGDADAGNGDPMRPGTPYDLTARSMVLLRHGGSPGTAAGDTP